MPVRTPGPQGLTPQNNEHDSQTMSRTFIHPPTFAGVNHAPIVDDERRKRILLNALKGKVRLVDPEELPVNEANKFKINTKTDGGGVRG